MADDIVERLSDMSQWLWSTEQELERNNNARAALAEITRLRAGGCSRDQGLTQYCAEAAKFAAEIAELRAEVERLRGETEWRPIGPEAFDGRHWMLARHMGEPWGWVYGCGYYARVHGIEGWVVRGLCDPPGELGLGCPTYYAPLRRLPAPPAPESSDA